MIHGWFGWRRNGRDAVIRLCGLLALIALGFVACVDSGKNGNEFPIEITLDRIERGAEVYDLQCASCHGAVNGTPRIPPAPPHGPEGHTWHHPDRLLYRWVMDGPPMATVMPGFRDVLTEEEALAVLAYIKSSWPDDIRERQNRGSAAYEAQLRE